MREVVGEFRSCKVSLEWASSYKAGLEAIRRRQHDLYLLDYLLKPDNGLELLREVRREALSEAPMIILTGFSDPHLDDECMLAGAADYLSKDHLSPSSLERAMRHAIDRASAQAALLASETRYRTIFDQLYDGVLLVDNGGKIESCNPAISKMFGYTDKALQGRGITELFCLEEGEKFPFFTNSQRETEGKRKDGRRFPLQIVSKEFELHGRRIWSVVLRDLSEIKEAQRALQATQEQLQQSQRLESIGLLAGGIAHDFNNLLTAITGYSDLILSSMDGNDQMRADLEEIRKAGERASTLTRQLLTFSRRQTMETVRLNLNTVFVDLEKMLRRLIGEDIELVAHLAPDLKSMLADPGQLEQVIMNLVVNARDAMPAGGKITIETSNVELDEECVRYHPDLKPGRYAMLAISDSGCGMDKKTKERIFEPFFTTKSAEKGTGLGLSTVYGIVKQTGGSIWVHSEIGMGTTFKIFFPLTEPVAQNVSSLDALPGGHETILLADNDVISRTFAKHILQTRGYAVLEAQSVEEALALCGNPEHAINLLVVDIVMPKVCGQELIEEVARVRPGLRVLFVSGYTDLAAKRHGIVEAGMPYLQKPFSSKDFAHKVRQVLDDQVFQQSL